jgi:hypothetical protein
MLSIILLKLRKLCISKLTTENMIQMENLLASWDKNGTKGDYHTSSFPVKFLLFHFHSVSFNYSHNPIISFRHQRTGSTPTLSWFTCQPQTWCLKISSCFELNCWNYHQLQHFSPWNQLINIHSFHQQYWWCLYYFHQIVSFCWVIIVCNYCYCHVALSRL